MELKLVWIHFFILYSDFTFSKVVIATASIPNYWKLCHEIVNNPDHPKITTYPNKKSSNNILNYVVGVQRSTKIVPSTNPHSYRTLQPTIRNLNSIYDISNKKVCGRSDTKMAHNNENLKIENKNVIYDKQQNNNNENNKDIDQVLEKRQKHTEIENVINECKNVDTFEDPNHAEIDIVHDKNMLEMLPPQKNDSSSNFLEKLCRNQTVNVNGHNKERNKNESNDKFIVKSHDLTEKKSVNTNEIKNDEISFDDPQNIQANFWHTLNKPKERIRYYMPNQYSLSDISNNYINKLYSKTKYSNPLYDSQGRFTSHFNYGADIRYRRPNIRY